MIELIELITDSEITESTGKKLVERVIDSGEGPKKIVSDEGMGRISGADELSSVACDVINENPQAVLDYKAGKGGALNFLMGQVMRKMKGRADAGVVIKLLKEKLK